MDEKIELVQAHRHQYGLNVCLHAVGLSKGTWHYRRHRKSQAERDAPLKAEIVSVIEAHPDYGERRIHAELVERTGRPINIALGSALAVLAIVPGALGLINVNYFSRLTTIIFPVRCYNNF